MPKREPKTHPQAPCSVWNGPHKFQLLIGAYWCLCGVRDTAATDRRTRQKKPKNAKT